MGGESQRRRRGDGANEENDNERESENKRIKDQAVFTDRIQNQSQS